MKHVTIRVLQNFLRFIARAEILQVNKFKTPFLTQNHSIAANSCGILKYYKLINLKTLFLTQNHSIAGQFMWDFEILQINKFKNPFFDTEPFDRRPIHVGFVVHKEAHR